VRGDGSGAAEPTATSRAVPSPGALADAELRELDRIVEASLALGEESQLAILGYGEMSLVLAWPPRDPRYACKRLPIFSSRDQFARYRRTFDDYLDALRAGGVDPVDSALRPVERDDGSVAGYAVQPVLPSSTLAPNLLGESDPAEGHPLVGQVVETAASVVSSRVGIDAQLSNWTWDDGRLRYLDITTPMLWTDHGALRLDVALLARSAPWVLRWPIRHLVAPRIIDGYRKLRGVYFDLCGNLIKQGLEAWLPVFLEHVNDQLDSPMTIEEVRRYYRSDARLWAMLLRIRRLDREWQRRVRRRAYPFLLPREIER
jgi:uncharacterized protein DUF6206